jgi:hypothetical protein
MRYLRKEDPMHKYEDHEEEHCLCALCKANRAWRSAYARVNKLRRESKPKSWGRITHPPIPTQPYDAAVVELLLRSLR